MSKQRATEVNLFSADVKVKAKRLHNILKEYQVEITYGECLHIYSKMEGFKDWNVMKAFLDQKHEESMRHQDIVDLATRVIESKEGGLRWLNAPNIGLGGKKPMEIWDSPEGTQQVINLLNRIECGVYS